MASDLNLGAHDIGNGIRVSEIGGRTGNDVATGAATAERKFRLWGTESAPVARTQLLNPSPAPPWDIYEFDGMQIEDLSYQWMGDSWDFSASYNAVIPEPGGFTVSIDTGGGTFKQTNSYATNSYAAAGESASDFKHAIDVQEGNVNGTDRIIPALRINIRAKIATAHVESPMAYSLLLAGLTGKTNQASFLTAQPGEMLFGGASGEVVAEEPMLSFAFIYSPNLTGLTIGDISGINKLGHQYLWFEFKSAKDSTNNLAIKIPRAAHAETIYQEGDFDAMKIGEP